MNYLFTGTSLRNKRQSNMDSLLLKCGYIDKKSAALAVICDGVGSLSGGAFASGTAAQMLNEWFHNCTTTDRIGLNMRDAILTINSHVITEARQRNIETASTLTALLLVESDYCIVHIGDSRVYSYDSDGLSVLTNDNISESGKLTACIGKTESFFLQYSEGSASEKAFLVCSDGLYNRMDLDYLVSVIKTWSKRTLNEPTESLPNHVIKRGEHDNISFALVKLLS